MRLSRAALRKQNSKHGMPGRRIVRQWVTDDGVEHSLHATKGWRKVRLPA